MRYRSIPRIILDNLSSGFRYLKSEFGNWAYIILAFIGFILYKPILKLLDLISQYILYAFLGFAALVIFYMLFSKIFRMFRK